MENLDKLYQWLSDEGVFLFDRQLPFSREGTKSTTVKLNGHNTWGIFLDKGRIETEAEENTVLLHESGHYSTGTTHEVCSPWDLVEKHEHKAWKWAIRRSISKDQLDEAVAAGYSELWELADFFGVTEDFMRKAVCLYVHGNLNSELYF